jgi:hypothetical protein
MNYDLELRLTPYQGLSLGEKTFWEFLCDELVDCVDSGYHITIHMLDIDPPNYPDDDTGFVEYLEYGQFAVYLDHRMPLGMCIDYLIHELAHVGTWFVNEPEDHGPMFGVEYARLYRRYLELYGQYWEIEQ